MRVRYTMIYWYRNNHYITVNNFNEYFAIRLSYGFCIIKYAFVCLFNCAWHQISEIPNGTISFLLEVHCCVFFLERLLCWRNYCCSIPRIFCRMKTGIVINIIYSKCCENVWTKLCWTNYTIRFKLRIYTTLKFSLIKLSFDRKI